MYIFQAAFDGVYYAEKSLYTQSKTSYGKAIYDQTLKLYTFKGITCGNPENPDAAQIILAYSRFRFVELLAFLHRTSEAEGEWRYLSENYPEGTPGYRYALLANTFWEAYQTEDHIDNACAAVRDEDAQYQKEISEPLYFGTAEPGPTLDTICPFHSDGGGK
jgi:hypothetical protein